MPADDPCPQVPHPFVQIYLYHCAHVGQWVLHIGRGATDDPSEVTTVVRFGPFDDLQVVLDWITGYVVRSQLSPPG